MVMVVPKIEYLQALSMYWESSMMIKLPVAAEDEAVVGHVDRDLHAGKAVVQAGHDFVDERRRRPPAMA